MDERISVSTEGIRGLVGSDGDCAVALRDALVIAGQADVGHFGFSLIKGLSEPMEHCRGVRIESSVVHCLDGE